jgi:penicillin-insensitive murein DD-endopeptidase
MHRGHVVAGLTFATALAGCARAPSPLTPAWHGSIGTPNHGVLAGGAEVPRESPGMRWLRNDDRHWAQARLAGALARAAAMVARARPGATLRVGDVSVKTGGGPLPPHLSHRSGVDVDLLLYVCTLDGAPVDSPGFVHFGADGIARDEAAGRWLRLDVERQWLLIKALVEDAEARVQWLFVSDVVQALLIEWALARGESLETIRRARDVMLQPKPGGIHDDHVHLRVACSPEEAVAGCETIGPRRPWLDYALASTEERDEDLAMALLVPVP